MLTCSALGVNLGKEFPNAIPCSFGPGSLRRGTRRSGRRNGRAAWRRRSTARCTWLRRRLQAQPHHHKGLFGRRHCVECQRAYAKAHDGVDVPAPPPLEPGMQGGAVVQGGANCPTCQGNMVASGPVSGHELHAPGYAVVGGPGGPDAPGYAVVGEAMVGSEPAPVGVAKRAHARRDGSSRGRTRWPRRARTRRSIRRSDQPAAGSIRHRVTAS